MKKIRAKIRWYADSEPQDYPAALSYLSLIFSPKLAKQVVGRLEGAPATKFASKDISRASGLSVLGPANTHVERDRERIRSGERLSPLLLVRDTAHRRVIIADGYHRLCAVYSFDEDAMIRCKICNL